MIKLYLGIALILVSFAAGIIITHQWHTSKHSALISEESSIVITEKINKVLKLTAVEAHFSEIYDYKDYYRWDWAPFRKKVLIRVNARVSAGFDFESNNINLDETERKVFITHPGPPSILSIDHDLEYYDIQQGAFNNFSEADYSRLQSSAKNFISAAASQNRPFFKKANEQLDDVFSTLSDAVSLMGWDLVIIDYAPPKENIKGPWDELALSFK
ncbi:MAG: DUF4230 domain-containing protein [Saprospirales bacterium]|nr:MAG: DUF4230 domain-containing protein [Saprospirales bacterium]